MLEILDGFFHLSINYSSSLRNSIFLLMLLHHIFCVEPEKYIILTPVLYKQGNVQKINKKGRGRYFNFLTAEQLIFLCNCVTLRATVMGMVCSIFNES